MSKQTDRAVDVALVGAGPIGLEMAVALKRAGVDYVHLEAGQIGQTIAGFPREMHFYSSNDRIAIAGLPLVTTDESKATREQYLGYLRQVARREALAIRSYEPVTGIAREGEHYLLRSHSLAGPRETPARNVILALGGTHRPRRLGIPGEDLLHVSHQFVEPHPYFGQRLLVVGGRNSAVEAALRCWHAGAQVALSYRRAAFDRKAVKYWLLPELEGRIARGEIEGHLATQPVAIEPGRALLRRADGETYAVAADFVLLLTGYEADTSLNRQLGLALEGEEQAPVLDPDTMESSLPGVYVIGTATAGTQQRFQIFLENCHVHVDRVLAALTGRPAPDAPAPLERPES